MKRLAMVVLGVLGVTLVSAGSVRATTISTADIVPVSGDAPSLLPGDDPEFTFSFASGGISASGFVFADPIAGGNFHATSGSITIAGSSVDGTYALGLGGPGVTNSTGNAQWLFQFDNVVYGSLHPQFVDAYGLFFTGSGREVNLWAPNASQYELTVLQTGSNNRGLLLDAFGPATASEVPEPTSMLLLATGLAGTLARARRRRN